MTVNKRKKNSRQRGYKTHGYGSMKKHRGSGHRGGVGMAGTGKRADSKKPSIWKEDYFGKKGFNTRNKKIQTVNVSYVDKHLEKFSSVVEGGKHLINLKELKLLCKGKVHNKLV